jgi:hypothetical protein
MPEHALLAAIPQIHCMAQQDHMWHFPSTVPASDRTTIVYRMSIRSADPVGAGHDIENRTQDADHHRAASNDEANHEEKSKGSFVHAQAAGGHGAAAASQGQ